MRSARQEMMDSSCCLVHAAGPDSALAPISHPVALRAPSMALRRDVNRPRAPPLERLDGMTVSASLLGRAAVRVSAPAPTNRPASRPRHSIRPQRNARIRRLAHRSGRPVATTATASRSVRAAVQASAPAPTNRPASRPQRSIRRRPNARISPLVRQKVWRAETTATALRSAHAAGQDNEPASTFPSALTARRSTMPRPSARP